MVAHPPDSVPQIAVASTIVPALPLSGRTGGKAAPMMQIVSSGVVVAGARKRFGHKLTKDSEPDSSCATRNP